MDILLKKCLTLGVFLLSYNCYAQNSTPAITPLTADSLSSGNYKNVFTSFFQLAINDISGPQKAIAFTANPYAIMARANPNLLVDTNYVRYKHLRDLNFNFDIKVDSSYHINGFSFGAKYALINARDNTVSNYFQKRANGDQRQYTLLNHVIALKGSTTAVKEFSKWANDTTYTYDKLSQETKDLILKIVIDSNLTEIKSAIQDNPKVSFREASLKKYNQLVEEWQNKPLWTVGGSGTFKSEGSNANALAADNIILSSEFLAGIISPKSKLKLELDLLAQENIFNDSTKAYQNIDKNIFMFQPGINVVMKSKNNGKPNIEFKVSGEYYHIFSGLQYSQKADSVTLNAELDIRVIDDIWLPVTIKYDINRGNVFGFLNVKANFTALYGILKKKS